MINFLKRVFLKPDIIQNQFSLALETLDRINLNYFYSVHHNKNSLKVVNTMFPNLMKFNLYLILAINCLSDNKQVNSLVYRNNVNEIYLNEFFIDEDKNLIDVSILEKFILNAKQFLILYERKLNENIDNDILHKNLVLLDMFITNLINIINVLEEYSNT